MSVYLRRLIWGAASLASGIWFAGCTDCSQTTYREAKRTAVEFESEAAGETFYAALNRMPFHGETEDRSHFEIPVVFHYTSIVKSGENEKFNEGVKRCDTNKDGRITEVEARIFASQYK
ncbi:MAG TPA: hypothetical protein VHB20_01170 [Verrucomicrobiae bacterium]|jgi:hypothetical protein|nr:hypothetical protein [Verrucomicrobiae bacterium]